MRVTSPTSPSRTSRRSRRPARRSRTPAARSEARARRAGHGTLPPGSIGRRRRPLPQRFGRRGVEARRERGGLPWRASSRARREKRDAAADRLREKYAARLASLQERLRRARAGGRDARSRSRCRRESRRRSRSARRSSARSSAARPISSATIGRATTAARSAGRTMKQAGDVQRAEETAGAIQQQIQALEDELQAELAAQSAASDPAIEKLEKVSLRPKKTDITVRRVALVWLPYRARSGEATVAVDGACALRATRASSRLRRLPAPARPVVRMTPSSSVKPPDDHVAGEVERAVEVEVARRGGGEGRVEGRGDRDAALVHAAPHRADAGRLGDRGDAERRPDAAALHQLDVVDPAGRLAVAGERERVLLAVEALVGRDPRRAMPAGGAGRRRSLRASRAARRTRCRARAARSKKRAVSSSV